MKALFRRLTEENPSMRSKLPMRRTKVHETVTTASPIADVGSARCPARRSTVRPPRGFVVALVAACVLLTTNFLQGQQSCNPIVCENEQAGNPPSEWDISGAGSSSIQGFATDMSVNQGQTVRFKIQTTATAYRLDIYRLGYYGGNGARKIATVQPTVSLPQSQ